MIDRPVPTPPTTLKVGHYLYHAGGRLLGMKLEGQAIEVPRQLEPMSTGRNIKTPLELIRFLWASPDEAAVRLGLSTEQVRESADALVRDIRVKCRDANWAKHLTAGPPDQPPVNEFVARAARWGHPGFEHC